MTWRDIARAEALRLLAKDHAADLVLDHPGRAVVLTWRPRAPCVTYAIRPPWQSWDSPFDPAPAGPAAVARYRRVDLEPKELGFRLKDDRPPWQRTCPLCTDRAYCLASGHMRWQYFYLYVYAHGPADHQAVMDMLTAWDGKVGP